MSVGGTECTRREEPLRRRGTKALYQRRNDGEGIRIIVGMMTEGDVDALLLILGGGPRVVRCWLLGITWSGPVWSGLIAAARQL